VNDAKRLQEAAPSGGLLIHASLADTARALGMELDAPAPVLVKKNLIMACNCR
jgi:class 3 adenylate cyclase